MKNQKHLFTLISVLSLCVISSFVIKSFNNSNRENQSKIETSKLTAPNDLWYQVRSYPNGFSKELYLQAMSDLKLSVANNAQNRDVDLTLPWIEEGPGNIGGRFNVLKGSGLNNDILYAGAANGGLFKSTDNGANWFPIFDDLAYLAIGSMAIDENNENVLYVGTGDKNFGGGSKIGNGIYKSNDGGNSWNHIGLEQTGIVTEIVLHPTDSNIIYAATLGNTYEKTTERGVYKTTDGGISWTNILFLSDTSGIMDLVMDPTNPDVLYASGFNRINLPFNPIVKGPEADIYKTTDGGANWVQLTNGLPNSSESRVGLSISESNPNIVYALYISGSDQNILDVYKTTNGGASWLPLNATLNGVDSDMHGGFGWYFGEVYVNPYDSDHVILTGVDMYHSVDGGATWSQNVPDWWTYEVHADKHDVLFLGSDSYIIATDGGLYKTTDHGVNWTDIENIAVTQFYHIAVDPISSGVYGGGAQDNGSMSGNQQTFNNWQRLYGGDGFRMFYLEDEAGAMYVETQRGNIIHLDAGQFPTNVSPDLTGDRTNWDTPYIINEADEELFVGTSKVSVMTGAPFGFYQSVSGDLTKVPLGTAIGANSRHTISEIEQAKFDSDIMMVGTSDGLVWRGDRSGNWNFINVTTNDLPDRYVTGIKSSPDINSNFYVCYSGYTLNDSSSYLYMTSDLGQNWVDISGDLPNAGVNDIYIVPNYDDEYIFAALDGGVYFTENGGVNWNYVGTGLPYVTARELRIDFENEKLICGTYSRSIYSYDISWIDNLNADLSSIPKSQSSNFSFYPNPTKDQIKITADHDGVVNIYNVHGNLVYSQFVVENQPTNIDITSLAMGTYMIEVNGKVGKMVKN